VSEAVVNDGIRSSAEECLSKVRATLPSTCTAGPFFCVADVRSQASSDLKQLEVKDEEDRAIAIVAVEKAARKAKKGKKKGKK